MNHECSEKCAGGSSAVENGELPEPRSHSSSGGTVFSQPRNLYQTVVSPVSLSQKYQSCNLRPAKNSDQAGLPFFRSTLWKVSPHMMLMENGLISRTITLKQLAAESHTLRSSKYPPHRTTEKLHGHGCECNCGSASEAWNLCRKFLPGSDRNRIQRDRYGPSLSIRRYVPGKYFRIKFTETLSNLLHC